MPVEVRDYQPADEQGWLRCRVLSFLGTAYFDDVVTAKTPPDMGAELVAVDAGAIVGILDLSTAGSVATIETIAVHPDHQHRGTGTLLFEQACLRAAALGATTIDAWTRDDGDTLRWYRSRGFRESDHYLHVYADHYVNAAEPAKAVEPRPGLEPIKVFLHATLDQEAEAREKFRRVHVCRRFSQPIGGWPPVPDYRIRPATAEDVGFLTDVVFEATQAQGRVPDGFDEQQWRTAFAQWTREQLLGEDPDSAISVIEIDDQPIGRLRIVSTASSIELAGIQLLPGYQRHGIGTAVIEDLKAQSAALGIPLNLDVEKDNPGARRLYVHLGFTQVGETEQEYKLRWAPPAGG